MSKTSKNSSYSFEVVTTDNVVCSNTSLTDKIIQNMNNGVFLAAVTQDVTFFDSGATTKGISNYCGARSYSFSPSFGFLTISDTTMSL
jgi:hypothetical protein